MRIHRRQFLKYCVSSAAAMGLPMTVFGKLEQALAEGTTLPKVIWLNGANCTGCTVSLSNLFSSNDGSRDIADLLLHTIDLVFHPTLMAAAGDLAVQQLTTTAQGSYILAVEGGIPTAFGGNTCMLWSENGHEVTAMEAVQQLAPSAAAVLSIGTCASYGGIPAAGPNPTGIVGVGQFTGQPVVNMPGCPTHPDWIVWTIAHLLAGEMPQLDERGRPTALYGIEVHKTCPRKEQDEVKTFGTTRGCLKALGCRGPETHSDCPSRKWNSGINWCIDAGAICIGCTHDEFPNKFSPFYKIEYSYQHYDKQVPEDPPADPPTDPPSDPPTEPPTDPPSSFLRITSAEWLDSRSLLTVKGVGDPGQIVAIYNGDNMGDHYGVCSVSRRGTWKFRTRKPSPVPNRVLAMCNGDRVTSTVAGAPVAAEA